VLQPGREEKGYAKEREVEGIGPYEGPWGSGGSIRGHKEMWVDIMRTRKEIQYTARNWMNLHQIGEKK
jgi:hypothetical protein